MEVYVKRGRWVVDNEDGRFKFSTKAEAYAFAGLAAYPLVEEPVDSGDEEEEDYTEEFDFEEDDAEDDDEEEEDS
jgi:hypothetical protein